MALRKAIGPRRWVLWLVVVVLLQGMTACVQSADAPSGPGSLQQALSDTVRAWLPVGTIVPVGASIPSPPEPYDPAKHGRALRPDPSLQNLANTKGYQSFPKLGRLSGGPGASVPPPPGSGDRGFWLAQASRPWYGMSAMYDLNLSLRLPTP